MPRYRLAPQHPFPAAILDSLISYLYLLYPPPNAPHKAYTADQIFLGGDSAGGGLATGLTQLLLWLNAPDEQGNARKVRWLGEDREVPLPKALIIISGWMDLARCFVEIGPGGRGGGSEMTCAAADYSK